ncbi:MAG: DUF285 domain-containing protein [Lactobacillaceae bacterium]|jgi:surface protein|nr:DUF285 domain-containing protein [Lactobacillaceae bacterium]
MKIHKKDYRLVRAVGLMLGVISAVSLFTNVSFNGTPNVASAATSEISYDAATKTTTIGPGELPELLNQNDFVKYAETIVFVSNETGSEKVIPPDKIVGTFNDLGELREMKGVQYLDTSNVTDMGQMFKDDFRLTTLDLSSLNTANVESMYEMFAGCSSLTSLDFSGFDTSEMNSTEGTDSMFNGTTALWKLTLGQNFVLGPNSGLLNPVKDTPFNGDMSVKSDKWLQITGGTDLHPTGVEYTAAQIPTAHISGNTDTYVWQNDPIYQTTTEYTVAPSYMITIPAKISIQTATTTATGDVVLSDYPKLPYASRFIRVAAVSNAAPAWHLTTPGDTAGAEYDFYGAGATDLKAGAALVFEANGEQPTTSKAIFAELTDSAHKFKYAGTYTDTVTFTITTAAS